MIANSRVEPKAIAAHEEAMLSPGGVPFSLIILYIARKGLDDVSASLVEATLPRQVKDLPCRWRGEERSAIPAGRKGKALAAGALA